MPTFKHYQLKFAFFFVYRASSRISIAKRTHSKRRWIRALHPTSICRESLLLLNLSSGATGASHHSLWHPTAWLQLPPITRAAPLIAAVCDHSLKPLKELKLIMKYFLFFISLPGYIIINKERELRICLESTFCLFFYWNWITKHFFFNCLYYSGYSE